MITYFASLIYRRPAFASFRWSLRSRDRGRERFRQLIF